MYVVFIAYLSFLYIAQKNCILSKNQGKSEPLKHTICYSYTIRQFLQDFILKSSHNIIKTIIYDCQFAKLINFLCYPIISVENMWISKGR